MDVENILTTKKLPTIVITHQDSQSSESSETSNSDASIFAEPEAPALHYKVNDVPKWNAAIIFGLQQAMLCFSGMLVMPYIVSETVCPGADVVSLRVRLISSTFVVTGIATLLQTTFGLRLPLLQGPSFAFLPPLYAFADLPEMKCNYTTNDLVPETVYLGKLNLIQGSLVLTAAGMCIIGASGVIGKLAHKIGPITTCPLMFLQCLGTIHAVIEKSELHWISIIQFLFLLAFTLFLAEKLVPMPYYSDGKFQLVKCRLFGQFPYLLAIGITYLFATILTVTNLESPNGEARIDKPQAISVLKESPWFQVPYPGQFGMIRVSLGLFLGMFMSALASKVESLGDYAILAKVANEKSPPISSINRALMMEGIGSLLAGWFGVCVGVTSYSENIASIAITRVASRVIMQIAGLILIFFGVFTKVGAVLATIPDAMIGGILGMGMCMVCGVAVANLQTVELKLSRNLTIMGTAVILGMCIPKYFADNPINTGVMELDQMLNILLNINMFVGGIIAFALDNLVGGATPRQRGFLPKDLFNVDDEVVFVTEIDGYSFPKPINTFLRKFPMFSYLPFMPSLKRLGIHRRNVVLDPEVDIFPRKN